MRPINLKFAAFGPYVKVQEINFNDFKNDNLFMIAGPTGSGKSTIFDAIMFALYGESALETRETDTFFSDFAEPGTKSFVEFSFIIQQQEYRICRYPKQYREKLRGSGLKLEEQKAELFLPDGKILVKISEIRTMIEQIIGLNAKQFRQIVLLAQGEFKKLLLAKSSEREVIFRRLFNTETYLQMQQKLNQKLEDEETQVKELEAEQKSLFKQIGINLNDVTLNQAIMQLRADIKNDQQVIEEIEMEQSKIEKQIFELQKEKEMYILKVANQKRLTLKEERYQHLDNLTSTYLEIEKQISQHRKVLEYKEIFNQYHELEKLKVEYTENQQQIEVVNQQYQKLIQQKIDIDETQVQKQLNDKQNQLHKINGKIELSKPKIIKQTKLLELEQKSAKLLANIKNLQTKELDNNERISKYKKQIDEIRVNIETITKQQIDIAKLRDEQANIEQKLNNQLKVETLNNKHSRYNLEVNELIDQIGLLTSELTKIEIAKNQEQAAFIALRLEANKPCPVCGSKKHPSPAKYQVEKTSSLNEVNLQDKLFQLETKKQKKLQDMAIIQGEINSLKANESTAELKKNVGVIEEKIQKMNDELIKNQQLLSSKTELELLSEVVNKEQLEVTKQLHNLKLDLASQKSLIEQLNNEVDKQTDYQSEINKLEVSVKDAESLIRKFQEKLSKVQSLNEQVIKFKTEIKIKTAKQEENRLRIQSLKKVPIKVNQILRDLEIDSVELVIKIIEQDFSKEMKELYNYQKEKADLISEINELRIEIENDGSNFSEVKIATLEQKTNQKEREIKKKTELSSQKRIKNNTLLEIERINQKISDQSEIYNELKYLANLSDGGNQYFISFERYIMAVFFEEIISAANLRLQKMSNNRYLFIRQTDGQKRTTKRGLDLMIFDYFTGKKRDVATLSGGESFKASISLALGLSDVVRMQNGGIELETLFIDEGFGTLDSDSLESALDVLNELKQDGRLIGVISHVEELKQQIQQKINILPTKEGSEINLSR